SQCVFILTLSGDHLDLHSFPTRRSSDLNNPVERMIPMQYSNWLQLLFSLPVVFYACWTFFERAWTSFKTWNLNMFSLIGLGAGAGFVFSLVGLFFPDIFPDAFKGHDGSVHLYFEAVVVILTLVLLGQ